MKIIFEYEDGTYRVILNMKLSELHKAIPEHEMIASYLSDKGDFKEYNPYHTAFGFGTNVVRCVNKYIIADDNRLAGFVAHKDKKNTWENIKYLERRLAYHRNLMDELNKMEDLSVQTEKTIEQKAIDEVFEYAERRMKLNVHTRDTKKA